MVALRLTTFAGMFPVRDIRLLPEQVASEAVNLDTSSGALQSIAAPRRIKTLQASTRYTYRLPYTSAGAAVPISDLDNSTWIEFADPDTDVVRTPTVNDSFERYYWCSPSTGYRYATRSQLLAGTVGKKVGVRAPTLAPNVVPVAGTGAIKDGKNTAPAVTRSYIVTWVSEFGEESAPSPPAEAAGFSDQDWVISSIQLPDAVADEANITGMRLYRTVTSSSGVSTFFLVDQLTTNTSVYTDQFSDTIVTGKRQIESVSWATPPDMDGIAAMPNGIIVGFKGSTLYFSENYRPHAWPAAYAITVQYPIVGLGVFGNTCVVCTTGAPAAVSGVKASTMALVQSTAAAPCLSRRGIVSAMEGVYFPSDDGLVLFGPAGMKNVTEELIGRDRWLAEYAPHSLRAVYVGGEYTSLRGTPGAMDGFTFSPMSQSPTAQGVSDLNMFTAAHNIGTDVWSGRNWLIDNGALMEWEPIGGAGTTYRWRSKEFQLPEPGNLAAAQIFHDAGAAVRMRVWADRRLVYDHDIPGPAREFRLPSGFKAAIWQVEVETSALVHAVHIASTVTELRGV